MKWICNFSGGLCSFFAARREIERHGEENVVLLFADTLIEHADLYAFNKAAEQLLGIKITRLCKDLTPWQLFRKEGLLGNNRFPICSVRLKREPLNEWMAAHYEMDSNQNNAFYEAATVTLGFDWNEAHRVLDFKEAHPSWNVSAPMTEEPIWDKCRMIKEGAKLGLPEQTLYNLGFPHNNCGGGCVKAGIAHFEHLYHRLPEVFAEWEREEEATRQEFKRRGFENWDFTILKRTKDKVTSSFSLNTLRQLILAGETFKNESWGGCGCGGVA